MSLSVLDLDGLLVLLAEDGPNDQQLVALAELVRRASDGERYKKALDDAFLALPYRPENDQVRMIIGKALQ